MRQSYRYPRLQGSMGTEFELSDSGCKLLMALGKIFLGDASLTALRLAV
jgi:hypothetical protein